MAFIMGMPLAIRWVQNSCKAQRTNLNTMTGEFIWVFGASAVGKKFFINKLSQNGQEHLRTLLAIKDVIVCKESLEPRLTKDPIDFNKIVTLMEPDKSVLIKIQWPEIEPVVIPAQLKGAMPNANHRIIFLCASKSEWNVNIGKREEGHWTYEGVYDYNLSRLKSVAEELNKDDGFDILFFNTQREEIVGTSGCYEVDC